MRTCKHQNVSRDECDHSARPLERVCGVRVVCKLTMPVTSFVLNGYL